MAYRINGHVLPLGPVSERTLRTEDLLKAFADEVERYSLTYNSVAGEAREWLDGETYNGRSREEVGTELVNDLIDQLNEMAPEGVYFGNLEGDGACFGWFPADPESEDW